MSSAPAVSLEEYQTYLPFIRKAVYRVQKEIGGDIDEMLANGWLLFIKACENFNPQAGRKFSSYLYKVAWDDTYAARRIECHRKKVHPTTLFPYRFDVEQKRPFNFDRFMGELSNDAKAAVEFILNPPETVILKQDGTPKINSLKSQLIRQFQWTTDQFFSVAEEIMESMR